MLAAGADGERYFNGLVKFFCGNEFLQLQLSICSISFFLSIVSYNNYFWRLAVVNYFTSCLTLGLTRQCKLARRSLLLDYALLLVPFCFPVFWEETNWRWSRKVTQLRQREPRARTMKKIEDWKEVSENFFWTFVQWLQKKNKLLWRGELKEELKK